MRLSRLRFQRKYPYSLKCSLRAPFALKNGNEKDKIGVTLVIEDKRDDCRGRSSNSRKSNRLYWSRKFLMPLLYFISLTITF